MKYREDMMENLENSSGMCLDRPGTTPNVLPLEGSSHVLERERRELLVGCGRFGVGRRKRHPNISQVRPTPRSAQARTVCYTQADRPPLKIVSDTRLELPLVNFSHQRRTVRGSIADRPHFAQWTHHWCIRSWPVAPMTCGPSAVLWRTVRHYNFDAENLSAKPLVNRFHERWTVRLLHADHPRYQNSLCPEICQLSSFQLQNGIIAHKKI